MKCPFCEVELEDDIFYAGRKFYSCTNPKCKINDWGGCSEQILQALIEGKKAQDALKIVEDKLQQIHLGVETSIDPRSHAMTLVVIQSIASDALKIIAPITKQDTKGVKMSQIKIQDLFPLFKKPGWVAMDFNKRWYWYAYEPTINTRGQTFIGLSPKDLSCMFDIAPFDGDWKDSLMECGK